MSSLLPLFWHCDAPQNSFRNTRGSDFRQRTVNGFDRESGLPKGLAMLIRSEKHGILGEAAQAVHSRAIPAVPTLLIGGLLLLIGP